MNNEADMEVSDIKSLRNFQDSLFSKFYMGAYDFNKSFIYHTQGPFYFTIHIQLWENSDRDQVI